MNNTERADPLAGQALRAELSAVEIDIRCALVLARIALQTLADATPENNVRILNAIDDAIDGARLEEGERSEAVIGLLNDFKQRLVETSERVWYLEE
jgi:hypothetical protein